MPALSNKKHERVAQFLANGKSAAESYALVYGKGPGAAVSANRLLKNANFAKRLEELKPQAQAHQESIVAKVVDEELRTRVGRAEVLIERRNVLRQIVAERAAFEDHQDVPGGKTGFVLTTRKAVGRTMVVKEHAIDLALLKELREIERQIASELGQVEDKSDVTHRFTSLREVPAEILEQWRAEAAAAKAQAAPSVH